MKKDQYLLYGAVAVVVVVVALFAGLPWVFLLVLACPLMMLFMMKGMQSPREAVIAPAPTLPALHDPQDLHRG